MPSRRKLLSYAVVFVVVGIVIIIVWAMSSGFFKPVYDARQIVMDEWEFSTYLDATIYNRTLFGYPSLVFNVSSSVGSEAYMLTLDSAELPLKSVSLIRSFDSSCRIDWGWLGFGNNYMFFTWNGTRWIANTDNGSGVPEVTIVSGYSPSSGWRKLSIEATLTEVKYYLDDDLVATHVNKIPSGDFQFYGELESTGTATELYIAWHES